MSRINTNVSALIAQNNLAKANSDLGVRLERLSTGLQINRGADNPAGLIVSERLRSEIAGITQALDNAERASNVIATAEAALAEVSNLLTSIKGLVVQAANTSAFSKEEIEANQMQIDSAVDSITRISNTTSFAGLKLLNGSLDYIISGAVTSQVQDIHVLGANFGTATTMPVSVEVLNSATTAQLFLSGGAAPTIASAVTLEISGTKGAQTIQLASGATFAAVVQAVNLVKDATGVSASLVSTSGVAFSSTDYGSDAFVSLKKVSGGASLQTLDAMDGASSSRETGQDVLALVNGNLALGDGKKVGLKSAMLNLELTLTTGAAQNLGTYTFDITGGGARYQIGPSVNSSQQVGFGLPSIAASHLGDDTVGYLNSIVRGGANSLVGGDTAVQARAASDIIDVAISQVAVLRGRIGAFERNTLQTAVRSQQIALENLTASESQIRDTDFAEETSRLTRAQVLVSAGTSTLAMANSSAQNVLRLLQV